MIGSRKASSFMTDSILGTELYCMIDSRDGIVFSDRF